MADDDEVGLPQKGLNMIIKDVLPDLRIANESRELLNQCCVEFVRHISREAQRISSCDQRKTIYHDHVQKALCNLAFPADYVHAANSVLGECKIAAEKRLKRKKSRLDKCGIPEEELYLMQQELIEKARREEAEKELMLQYQQQQMFQQSSSADAALMLAAAQNNPALMAQWLAAGGGTESITEWTSALTAVAGGHAIKAEIKEEPAAESGSSASAADPEPREEAVSEPKSPQPVGQPAAGTAMSGEMRAQLAADFVASLGTGDEEDYD